MMTLTTHPSPAARRCDRSPNVFSRVNALTCRLALGLAAIATLATPAAAAVTDAEVAERARVLLSGFEHVPTADDWARVGPSTLVADVLMRFADGDGASTMTRYRALSSLSHFPTKKVRTFLEARIAQKDLSTRVRAKALRALGAAFKEKAIGVITPILAHEDPSFREEAVKAMQPMAAAEVQKLLEARLSQEPVAWVRQTMGTVAARVADNRAELLRRKLPVPSIAPIVAPPAVQVRPAQP